MDFLSSNRRRIINISAKFFGKKNQTDAHGESHTEGLGSEVSVQAPQESEFHGEHPAQTSPNPWDVPKKGLKAVPRQPQRLLLVSLPG